MSDHPPTIIVCGTCGLELVGLKQFSAHIDMHDYSDVSSALQDAEDVYADDAH